MIRNYFTIAWRYILKDRLTSVINILGLTLALCTALMIYLFVVDELKYDRYHPHAERTFRITRQFKDPDGSVNLHLASVAPPIGSLVQHDIGQVEVMARTLQFQSVVAVEENGIRTHLATEKDSFVAEPAVFELFAAKALQGDLKNGLVRPFTVMLSAHTATKYFNSTDIVGRHLRINGNVDLEVTGVYEDFPTQTHWHPELLISFSTLNDSTIYGRKQLETNWGNNSFNTYVRLIAGAEPQQVEAQFPAFLNRHFGTFAKKNWGAKADFDASKVTTLSLQPVTDIHLFSNLDGEIEVNGNINNVRMLAVIAVFIILIASFNFINLSTARATKRAKEAGLRKAVGAQRHELIVQYLSESLLICMLACALAIGLCWMSMGWLGSISGKQFEFNLAQQGGLVSGIFGFALLVGLLAGIYPAFVVSGFKPVAVLKGQPIAIGGRGVIRKLLVVSQFAISIVLIVCTLVSQQQLEFLNQKNLGFEKQAVVTLPYYEELSNRYDAFYQELTRMSAVVNLSRSSRVPTGSLLDSFGSAAITVGDSLIDTGVELKVVAVDKEFFRTYGISFLAGEDFTQQESADDSLGFIINHAAALALGWKRFDEGLGQDFQYGEVTGKLKGIVGDFHFESLHQKVAPMVFMPVKLSWFNALSIKLSANNFQAGLQELERTWREFLPDKPFEYEFLNDTYRRLYDAELRENNMFGIFSGMAIFIALLGLFGLTTFSTTQRTREIGIRKVLGATRSSILKLLCKETTVLILVANLIAWPVAWLLMVRWLDAFAYHVPMSVLVCVAAGVSALVLALIIVGTQSFQAASVNPAKTLKVE